MKRKRSTVLILLEAAVVLMITAAVFRWGQSVALAERGYAAIGGECLLLLIPVIYYAGKRVILDWAADIWGKA